MRIALPLNQMLALVARGLCDSQACYDVLELVFMVASLVSCGGFYETVGILKGWSRVLVVCNPSQGNC
jgi:hypothetical protein